MKKSKLFFLTLFFCVTAYTQELPKIAVYTTGGKTENENKMLSGQITHALVNSGRFRTIERAEAFIEQVEREHVAQRSGAVDDSQISRLGQQAGAQFVCIAEMVEAFGGYQITARIVNVESVEITYSGIATGELRTMADFVSLSQEVVATLLGSSDMAAQSAPTVSPSPTPAQTTATQRASIVYGTFTDIRDDRTYRTVVMPDGKTWMAENLNYRHPSWTHNDTSRERKVKARDKGSWCYDNEASNCDTYGRLYTWSAAMEACPAGWHLPSHEEWTALANAVGGSPTAGTKLKSETGWQPSTTGTPVGTDRYGFSALPGGYRNERGSFSVLEYAGQWWTATEDGSSRARGRNIIWSLEYIAPILIKKNMGYSVRCVQD